MKNELAETKMTAKELFNKEAVKSKFQELLGQRATGFITSVLQIVSSNALLKSADPNSVFHAAAVAATLDLPLNNNLGFAWIVPYKKNSKDKDGNWHTTVLAQFQIGYKGYTQLAQRTGEYQRMNVIEVYENQFKGWNPLTEEIDADFTIEGTGQIVGYCCYFKLINGFEKLTYWKKEKVIQHAQRYSKSYSKPKSNDNGNAVATTGFSGVWETEFDKMAKKTVLKNTLEKWGILSIEMRKAIKVDQAVINDADSEDVTYIDGANQPVDKEEERISLMISDAKTIEDLDKIYEHVPDSLIETFLAKKEEISKPQGVDAPELELTADEEKPLKRKKI